MSRERREWTASVLSLALVSLIPLVAQPEPIWVEGESAAQADVLKHPWYHGQVKKGELSGGEFVSHFSNEKEGRVRYEVAVPEAGDYLLWIRANPVQSRMSLSVDGGKEIEVDFKRGQTGNTNIAADGKPDLRFLAWSEVGSFKLEGGKHRLEFRFTSKNSHHGAIDCFVLAPPDFKPMGILKPDQIARQREKLAKENEGWVPWLGDPSAKGGSMIDLRFLNEKYAGEKGGVVAKGPDFVFRKTGEKVRFWAVNGPPHDLHGEDLAKCARMLASKGVNMVRLHGKVFNESTGELDRAKTEHIREVVAAMKKEGIYSHLSIYFPLWMKPKPGPGWREGYDGNKHPFALLYFEPDFQELHRQWLKAALDGLLDEPAVFGIELVNEDSLFFWTFADRNIPDPQLRKFEKQFGDWAVAKHGSVAKAIEAWGGMKHPRDGDGRLGFRPLWNIVNERKPRDRDTVEFLMSSQRGYYGETVEWLRGTGFKGLVTASNWHTADPVFLGPLEKYSYTVGDFIDRHGYFGCMHSGDNAAWSIRDGHIYGDRSGLRFDPEKPSGPKLFSNPVIDPEYNGMPSMISETTYNRPNRYRVEAPWLFACYGALQGSDAVVHFALDSSDWAVKPGFFMQPWTLMTPTQVGQFPAAAVLFRESLVREGPVIADYRLSVDDAVALKGSPIAHAANLDELRKSDVPEDDGMPRRGIDPLAHFMGRVRLEIGDGPSTKDAGMGRIGPSDVVRGGELELDYARGLLTVRAEGAQGVVGAIEGTFSLPALAVRSTMELGAIVAVSMDGKPLAESGKVLLQVMSEEKATGFRTEPTSDGRKRIVSIGKDPWLVRELSGEAGLRRADAESLTVHALDRDGRVVASNKGARKFGFRPACPYYLITAGGE
ncbi:glycosylhydrolase family 5 [Haloferula helveola]|uniref:Glycosylhydrolase family 5 n=2 Tax=Haloferula helveola TaxID=490095 RepID=A0ABM7RFU9_9BACT|nr:glycosylhydrolase family 5 [Haloferula helveola]